MVLCVVGSRVMGVTRLHDVVCIVCHGLSEIIRFDSVTHQRLTDIPVSGLSHPYDIAACQQTDQLYVADRPRIAGYVWRV